MKKTAVLGLLITLITPALLWAQTEEKTSFFKALESRMPVDVQKITPTKTIKAPDLSLIGLVQGSVFQNEARKDQSGILLKSLEIGVQGTLASELRGDAFLSLTPQTNGTSQIAIEEAYITFPSPFLADNLSAKLGKKRIDFGKINALHAESWGMVTKPSVMTQFLGNDGAVGQGLMIETKLPTPFSLNLSIGTWRNFSETPTTIGESFAFTDWLGSARLNTILNLSRDTELELGSSVLMGSGTDFKVVQDKATVYGLDMTFKNWAKDGGMLWQSELLFLNRDWNDTTLRNWGAYTYFAYKFSPIFEAGLRLDISESAKDKTAHKSVSLITTKTLNDATKFRIQFTKDYYSKDDQLLASLVFGLGSYSTAIR
ncbi:MAG: hypothetical protein AB7F28_06950 [Candidatus Margulisiibacteriota bacterium]